VFPSHGQSTIEKLYACHRLLGGIRIALKGPRVSEQDHPMQGLAHEFILESLRVDLRHMRIMPVLKHYASAGMLLV